MTATPTRTSTAAPTAVLPTLTPTRTAYPTPTADCSLELLPIGAQFFSAVEATRTRYIYTQNGIGLLSKLDGSSTQLIDDVGVLWTGSLEIRPSQITDGSSTLRVMICDNVPPAPTATSTTTPTRPALPCAVADSIGVPVSPGTASLPLRPGTRFVVAQAAIFINVGAQAREIGQGNYQWDLGTGPFTSYSLTVAAIVYICVDATPTTTATLLPTDTPGAVGIGPTPVCVALSPTATVLTFSMPDLSISIPTLRPIASPTMTGTITATITATTSISMTAIVAFVGTFSASISTPAAAISTASAGYSWQVGQNTAATAGAVMQPAVAWLAVLNPNNAAWSSSGGPLWAIAPMVLPVLPIIIIVISVALARFFLWILNWILKFIDLIIKIVELIPFM
jgi:hypothetical protein